MACTQKSGTESHDLKDDEDDGEEKEFLMCEQSEEGTAVDYDS